ncbi:hypothetical protein F511_20663 [Dorcoceras hygrometricum]|uniref:Uncharacterized protein n=1 Tax=Dorcoceras hygrometricum TaxID=472368 RepID=A0A2Z7D5B1_9LAMI|nr:hypothetical protein F511_20663 [Dorcoceras hygrometricum]
MVRRRLVNARGEICFVSSVRVFRLQHPAFSANFSVAQERRRFGIERCLAHALDFVESVVRLEVLKAVSVGCEGERRYRTLISLLGSLATMRRVVNYHSSWARQRQVELFDASGIRVLYHGEWLITTLWTHPVATVVANSWRCA